MADSPFELPKQDPCYYCQVLSGENPAALILRTQSCAVLVNARQHQHGQLVIVPLRHAPTLLHLDETEAREIFAQAQRMATVMSKAFAMDGMLLYQNNGVASGQEVPHFHLHVVPQRFEQSRWGNEPPQVADALGREFVPHEPTWLDDEALRAMAGKIRQLMGLSD